MTVPRISLCMSLISSQTPTEYDSSTSCLPYPSTNSSLVNVYVSCGFKIFSHRGLSLTFKLNSSVQVLLQLPLLTVSRCQAGSKTVTELFELFFIDISSTGFSGSTKRSFRGRQVRRILFLGMFIIWFIVFKSRFVHASSSFENRSFSSLFIRPVLFQPMHPVEVMTDFGPIRLRLKKTDEMIFKPTTSVTTMAIIVIIFLTFNLSPL